jgi:hypothetical protein
VISGRNCSRCRCGGELVFRSRYEVWRSAVVLSYTVEGFGARLPGGSYSDVFQWIRNLRPYRGHCKGANSEFADIAYAVTHVIYTLNDYHRFRLSRRCLPDELEFLIDNMSAVLESGDVELLGEFVDALRALGFSGRNQPVRDACRVLASCQNADGSWGQPDEPYPYTAFHTTWTVIDALRSYNWPGRGRVPGQLRRAVRSG